MQNNPLILNNSASTRFPGQSEATSNVRDCRIGDLCSERVENNQI